MLNSADLLSSTLRKKHPSGRAAASSPPSHSISLLILLLDSEKREPRAFSSAADECLGNYIYIQRYRDGVSSLGGGADGVSGQQLYHKDAVCSSFVFVVSEGHGQPIMMIHCQNS